MADGSDDLQAIADAKADKYGVPKSWFHSLIGKGEGGFKSPDATSPKGAKGPGQLMPATAEAMGVADPTDHEQNLDGAAKYAGQMWRRYHGDAKLAAAAYNAGPGNADKHGRNWDAYPQAHETKPYVERVSLPSADEVLESAKPLPSADDLLAEPTPKKPTPLQNAKAAPPKISAASSMMKPLSDIPGDIGHQFAEAGRSAERIALHPNAAEKFIPGVQGAELLGAGAAQLFSPITGAAEALIGRPVANVANAVNDKLHIMPGHQADPEAIGNAATMLIPGAGEVAEGNALARASKASGVGEHALAANAEAARALPKPNALKATVRGPETEHQAAVARLRADGIFPAAHQETGGVVQRMAESGKANPYTGPGVRASENASNDSLNRGFYNKVLKPIGERVADDVPVGNKGVAAVHDRLDKAYEEVLPKINILVDRDFMTGLKAIERRSATLGPADQAQFKAIIDQDVKTRFGSGDTVNGRTFKNTESALSRWARQLAPDVSKRPMIDLINDVSGLIRDKAAASAPPGVSDRLKNINRSWAMFTRLQDAATRRLTSGGVVSPTDILSAVKKGDRSVRKGSFADGDAMLQQFAQDADQVLSPRHGTSHTPEIQETNKLLSGRGIIGTALGGAAGGAHGGIEGALLGGALGAGADLALSRGTNALARRLLERGPPKAAMRNVTPPQRVIGGGAQAGAISDQSQR